MLVRCAARWVSCTHTHTHPTGLFASCCGLRRACAALRAPTALPGRGLLSAGRGESLPPRGLVPRRSARPGRVASQCGRQALGTASGGTVRGLSGSAACDRGLNSRLRHWQEGFLPLGQQMSQDLPQIGHVGAPRRESLPPTAPCFPLHSQWLPYNFSNTQSCMSLRTFILVYLLI